MSAAKVFQNRVFRNRVFIVLIYDRNMVFSRNPKRRMTSGTALDQTTLPLSTELY